MGFSLRVTRAAIRAYRRQSEKAREDFEEAHAQMAAAAQELCSNWEGTSKDVFQAEQEAFDGWCKQLGLIGKDYDDLLDKALAEYETNDANNAAQWKS